MDNNVKAFLLLLIFAALVPPFVYNYLRSPSPSIYFANEGSGSISPQTKQLEVDRNKESSPTVYSQTEKNKKSVTVQRDKNVSNFSAKAFGGEFEVAPPNVTTKKIVPTKAKRNDISFERKKVTFTKAPKVVKLKKNTAKIVAQKQLSMRKRAAETMKRCSQLGSHLPPLNKNSNQYLVPLSSYKYAYYPIAKCGWTTWTHLLFNAAGKSEELSKKSFTIGWYSPFAKAGMQRADITFSNLTKFKERLLFIRNPYDRLVSAYKNKFLYGNYPYNPCPQWKRRPSALSFPQFVGCVLNYVNYPATAKCLSTQKVASRLDIHWTPQYWSSLPCHSNYTLIGHFDTLADDMRDAVEVLKLNTSVPHENSSKRFPQSLGYWYNQLPSRHREALQQLYKYDFEVFGFDATIPT